jgi:hypothetical protein
MRRQALPAPTAAVLTIGDGWGDACSGCEEAIEPTSRQYFVSLQAGGFFLFYAVCHSAWSTFKR